MTFRIHTVLFMAICLACAPGVSAQTAGYDLLQTDAGATVDLGGSIGVIALVGRPIQGATGNVDTIIHRLQAVPAGGGLVPTNVTAVSMKSSSPVNIGTSSSPQMADVYVTINNSGGLIPQSALPQPDALPLSNGSLTVRSIPRGSSTGSFDSTLTVNADLIFVRPGGNPSNAADIIRSQPAQPKTITSTGSTWSNSAPPDYPQDSRFPSGGFYPIAIGHIGGPHPVKPGSCAAPATQPSPGPDPSPGPSPVPFSTQRQGQAAATQTTGVVNETCVTAIAIQ